MSAAWEVRKLRDLCFFFGDGDWIESKDQSSGGIRLIQTGNVGDGVFKDRGEKARYISESTFERLKCTEVFEGDCLISRLPDPVGRSCILPDTGERMITAVDCTIARFDPARLLPEFFNFYSQSVDYLSHVDAVTTGTTRKRISRSNLGELEVPVPGIAEQRRIVAILDKAFESIAIARANAEKNLQNARELFESYLQALFGHVGDGWVSRRLADVCSQITVGHVGSMAKRYRSNGVPFLRSQNIRPFEVVLDNVVYIDDEFHGSLTKSRLRPGDVAIVRTGYPGVAAVIPADLPDSNCSDLVIVRPKKEVDPHYLAAFFNSAYGKNLVNGRLVGAAQKHFNVTAAKEVEIHLPPEGTQAKVVSELFAFRTETQRLESIYHRKLAALDELKQSLLHQAFSGKIVNS